MRVIPCRKPLGPGGKERGRSTGPRGVKGRIANLHHWRCRIHPRMARLKSRRGSGFALRGGVAVHSADRVTTPIVGAWRMRFRSRGPSARSHLRSGPLFPAFAGFESRAVADRLTNPI